MPRLSILLPAHNAADTIDLALRSTLRAAPQDAEILVLDDASTDDTFAVASSISSPRVRVLRSDAPLGVAQALNRMLAESDSELVARMDADDASLPWRFRASLRALGPGAEFVFTTVVEWRRPYSRPNAPLPISAAAFPYHLLLTNPVCHPTMVATRDVVDSLDGYRDVPSEDYDLWLRAAAAGRPLRRVATWGLRYRHHATQVSASSEWAQRSRGDDRIAAAFGDLSELLLGERFPRLVTMSVLDERERALLLVDFSSRFMQAVAPLSGAERRFLVRKLRTRLDAVVTAASPAISVRSERSVA